MGIPEAATQAAAAIGATGVKSGKNGGREGPPLLPRKLEPLPPVVQPPRDIEEASGAHSNGAHLSPASAEYSSTAGEEEDEEEGDDEVRPLGGAAPRDVNSGSSSSSSSFCADFWHSFTCNRCKKPPPQRRQLGVPTAVEGAHRFTPRFREARQQQQQQQIQMQIQKQKQQEAEPQPQTIGVGRAGWGSSSPASVVPPLQIVGANSSSVHAGSEGSAQGLRQRLADFITKKEVDSFLTSCILVNFVLLAVEHHGMPLWLEGVLEAANLVLTVIFAAELLIRLAAFGYRRFPL